MLITRQFFGMIVGSVLVIREIQTRLWDWLVMGLCWLKMVVLIGKLVLLQMGLMLMSLPLGDWIRIWFEFSMVKDRLSNGIALGLMLIHRIQQRNRLIIISLLDLTSMDCMGWLKMLIGIQIRRREVHHCLVWRR